MKYFLFLLIIAGFSGLAFAVPQLDTSQAFDYSDIVLVGKVVSVEILSEPEVTKSENTYSERLGVAMYEIDAEKYFKTSDFNQTITVPGLFTREPHGMSYATQPYKQGQQVLLYIQQNTHGYADTDLIIRLGDSQVVENLICKEGKGVQSDICNVNGRNLSVLKNTNQIESAKEFTDEDICGTGTVLVDGVCKVVKTDTAESGTYENTGVFYSKNGTKLVVLKKGQEVDVIFQYDFRNDKTFDGYVYYNIAENGNLISQSQNFTLSEIPKVFKFAYTPQTVGKFSFTKGSISHSGIWGGEQGRSVIVLEEFSKAMKFNGQCKQPFPEYTLAVKHDFSTAACVEYDTKQKLIERGWAAKDDFVSKTSMNCMTLEQSKETAPFFKTPTYLPEGYSHVCSQSGTPFESYIVYYHQKIPYWNIPELVSDDAIFIYQVDERNMLGDKEFQTYGSPEQRIQETYDDVLEKNPSLNPQLITINGMLAYAVDSCNDCEIQTANFTDGTSIQESTSTETRIKFIDEKGVTYLLETTLPLSELIKVAESLQ